MSDSFPARRGAFGRLTRNPSRRWSGRLLLGGAVVGLALATAGRAFEAAEEKESAAGLRGLFPFEVPDDLSAESLAELGGNWADWSKDLGEQIVKLYQDEELDVAGQRKQLELLEAKVAVVDRALNDARYASIHRQLLELRGRLARRLDLADAILDSLELDPQAALAAKTQAAREKAAAALAALETYLKTVRGGDAWLPYLSAGDLKTALTKADYDGDAIAVVKKALERLGRRQDLKDEAQKAFLSGTEFVSLEGALAGYAEQLEAKPKPVQTEKLREQLKALVAAIERYLDEETKANSEAVRKSYAAAQELAVDGGDRLAQAVRPHYTNFNLQIVASEDFISKLISEQHVETGTVNENVMGAAVYGSQRTTTTTGVDFKPDSDGARFDLLLRGVTRSNTSGSTDQATVFTDGYHTFQASKEIDYDGNKFTTGPGTIYVNANNRTTGARTGASGIPLFGSISENMAQNVARQRAGQSQAIAASRIRERVLPRFNKEVDAKFADLGDDLRNKVDVRLKEAGVFPGAMSFRTSDSHLRVSARLMEKNELGGDRPLPQLTPSVGLTLHVHESYLNNFFDRIPFAGRSLTNSQVRAELEKFFTKIAGREVKFDPPKDGYEEDTALLAFAATDPVRFRFENGEVHLVIRAGMKREGEKDIPTQILTVPLRYEIRGNQVHVSRGDIKVAPLDKPESLTLQLAQAGVIRKKIGDSIKDHTRAANFDIQREGKPKVPVAVRQISAVDGWLSLTIQ